MVRGGVVVWHSPNLHVYPAPFVDTPGVLVALVYGRAIQDYDHDFSVHDTVDGAETWSCGWGYACFCANALSELIEMFVGVTPLDLSA